MLHRRKRNEPITMQNRSHWSRRMRSTVLLVLTFLISAATSAQDSPFTGHTPLPADSSGSYRLLFGGHFHGASTNFSGFPAASILAGIDTINALRANALFSTGDLFLDPAANGERYRRSFFSKLDLALYNAPGNHDLESGDYEQDYGPSYGMLEFGQDRVVWLNTELDNGSIRNEQLIFLRGALQALTGDNVFIVSHRPIWAEGGSPYSALFSGNTRSLLATNFQKEVYPLVEEASQHASVFWISGSMAGRAPASIFFQAHAPNITFIQCAIRDVPRDALLVADVKNGVVNWQGISLSGNELRPVEEYDAVFWGRSLPKTEHFNARLIPMYIRLALGKAEFWYGLLSGVLVLVLLRRAFRRWL